MDIDLLSKMVKELILDSDEVLLPGLGTFVAELVPAGFSDRGYTINPPYRRLTFRQRQDENDTALVDFYASSNKIEPTTAREVLSDFLAELRETLKEKKTIMLPGLGKLRATKENNFFFIPNEDLDIYPAGFGLEAVSLKTHEETEDEFSATMANLGTLIDLPTTELELADDDPAAQSVAEEKVVETPEGTEPEEMAGTVVEAKTETETETETEPEPEPKTESKSESEAEPEPESGVEPTGGQEAEMETGAEPVTEVEVGKKKGGTVKVVLSVLLIILTVGVVLFAAFMLLAVFSPSTLDCILYTPEQLEILNYKLP